MARRVFRISQIHQGIEGGDAFHGLTLQETSGYLEVEYLPELIISVVIYGSTISQAMNGRGSMGVLHLTPLEIMALKEFQALPIGLVREQKQLHLGLTKIITYGFWAATDLMMPEL